MRVPIPILDRIPIPNPLSRGPDAISPTAHYTGRVWVRNGLSHDELATLEGRVMYDAVSPLMAVSNALGGPTIEGLLLARHRIIDALLTEAIEDGRVSQVLEVACGMSPRGWRFARRYGPDITYVEADLPDMAARKRRALERIGSLGPTHRVAEVNALRHDGPDSIPGLAATLDPDRGLAIVTEGLLAYVGGDDVRAMWGRIADTLWRFPSGLYLADLVVGGSERSLLARGFSAALSAFVLGRVHVHFDGEASTVHALHRAGFARASVQRADRHPAGGDARNDPGAAHVHVVEATTG